MRIIAGEFRGRKLLPPEGESTRPITDRVKQSLFDILAPRLPGSTVFDCFAGTGSLGLESISRGSALAVFFEQDRPAVQRLRRNIEALGVGGRSRIVAEDLFRCFRQPEAEPKADVIFLDPPYRFLRERPDALQALAGQLAQQLAPDGVLVFRHDAADALALPPLAQIDRRTYGGMVVELLAHPSG
jgi:16S rRNA (guanine966-N2)-methyltransferase